MTKQQAAHELNYVPYAISRLMCLRAFMPYTAFRYTHLRALCVSLCDLSTRLAHHFQVPCTSYLSALKSF